MVSSSSGTNVAIPGRVAKASIADTLAFLARVMAPTLGKGMFIRRPRMVALAARFGLDTGAVRCLQRLQRRYEADVLLLAIPGRRQAVVLSPGTLHAVLDATPDPFAPDTREKVAALSHFEPKTSLVSGPDERPQRRAFNDDLLESARPRHTMSDRIAIVITEEVDHLLCEAGGALTWPLFTEAWHRAVRRIVLGDAARDDRLLTDMLAKLRRAGNWAFLHPGRPILNREYHRHLAGVLARGEPGSLSARIAARPDHDDPAMLDQVTQWLFAFDAAGIATFRALALVVTQAGARTRAEAEIRGRTGRSAADLLFLRACLLESVRLWPTTPAFLRETTREVAFGDGRLPRHTQVLVFAPYFHRDESRLAVAHDFVPELWLEPHLGRRWPLVPFSEGSGTCPAHNFVPMMSSTLLAAILERRSPALRSSAQLRPDHPLPGTLNHFRLAFDLRAPQGAER